MCESDMSNKLVWSSVAETDFISVLSYLYYSWNKTVASNFEELVNQNVESILRDPLQYTFYSRRLNIRKCILTKQNTLYYHYDSGIVYIIRIYDTHQNPHKLKF